MIVYNGGISVRVGHDAFDMISKCHDRIVLPYNGTLWGDLINEIENIVLNSIPNIDESNIPCTYRQVVAYESLSISFNVQRTQIRVMAIVDAVSIDGYEAKGKIRLDSCNEELYDILSCYFEKGSIGLDPMYAKYYQLVFSEWMKNRIVK